MNGILHGRQLSGYVMEAAHDMATWKARDMRKIGRLTVLLCSAAVLLGCAALVPTIRDDYMGKSLLQPDKVPQAVEYDDKGNPIPEGSRSWLPRLFPYVFRSN